MNKKKARKEFIELYSLTTTQAGIHIHGTTHALGELIEKTDHSDAAIDATMLGFLSPALALTNLRITEIEDVLKMVRKRGPRLLAKAPVRTEPPRDLPGRTAALAAGPTAETLPLFTEVAEDLLNQLDALATALREGIQETKPK